MLANLCKGNPDLSKQFSTLSNKSRPVVVSFKCSSDNNSSVISKFSSNPLINTGSCAVSFIPVLSSSASEYHSNDFPASNSCSDRFCAIPPIRRTIVLLDRNRFNFGSDFWACNINSIKHTLLYKFRVRKRFVVFGKFISKHETGFCGGLLYDCLFNKTKKHVCCCCFSLCHWLFAVVYFLTNYFQNYRV